MLRYLGIGLLGLFALLVMPVGADNDPTSNADRPVFYGGATIVALDRMGNEMFQQTVHNRLLDDGESALLGAVFSNGTAALGDDDAVGAICVSDNEIADAETITDITFDALLDTSSGGFTTKSGNCITDATVDTATTQGTAIVQGAQPFTASTSGTANLAIGESVTSIAICNAKNADGNYTDCGTEGRIFAYIDISNVTLGESETVTITYTFDIRSDNN